MIKIKSVTKRTRRWRTGMFLLVPLKVKTFVFRRKKKQDIRLMEIKKSSNHKENEDLEEGKNILLLKW